MKRILSLSLAIVLIFSGIVFTPEKTFAATDKVFIIKRGESINFTYSISGAILYKYGEEDKKLVTASVTNSKCSITAKQSSGTAVFYICKNSTKSDANIVYNVRVYVIQDPSSLYPNIVNSIGGEDSDNKAVHVYEGDSFNVTLKQPEQDDDAPSVPQGWQVNAETTKKATVLIGHECFEVRDSAGNAKQSGDTIYLTPSGAFSSNKVSRTFQALTGKVASGKYVTTYIRFCMKWTSSNGNTYYTKRRVIAVRIYSRPTITLKNGDTTINQLSSTIGDSKYISYKINNLQSSDKIEDFSITPTSISGVSIKRSGNGFYVTTTAETNQNIEIKFKVEGVVSANASSDDNSDEYPTFKFYFRVIGINIGVPTLKQIEQVKEGLKLTFTKVVNAGGYKIYRSKEKNGGYSSIGKTYDNTYFIDETANYKTTYYYKITALTKDSAQNLGDEDDEDDVEGDETGAPSESDFSNVLSSYRVLGTPSLVSLKKVKNNYYQIKMYSKDAITGFQILDNGVPISYSNLNTAIIKLKSGYHSITTKTYSNPFIESDENDEEIDDGIDSEEEPTMDDYQDDEDEEDDEEEDSFVGVIKPKSRAVYSKPSNAIKIYIKAKDKKKPTVKGVKNKKTYKRKVKIKFSDKSGIKKATLNGKKIKSGKKVSKNGKYKLIVIDKVGNKRVIKFRIKRKRRNK